PLATFETLWVAGRGIAYGKALEQQLDQLDPGFAELIRRSANYGLGDYLQAMQQRAAFANQVHALFEDYDLLIMPTLPILPFAADDVAPAGGRTARCRGHAGRRLLTLSTLPATRPPTCRAAGALKGCPSACKLWGHVLPMLTCCNSVPLWKP
ncbi:amidase family protein, partial [Pseudomonas syringae pv. actinidiae ICMP 19070]